MSDDRTLTEESDNQEDDHANKNLNGKSHVKTSESLYFNISQTAQNTLELLAISDKVNFKYETLNGDKKGKTVSSQSQSEKVN